MNHKDTLRILCLIIAAVLFAIAAMGVPVNKFNLVAAGLFFFTLGELAGLV